MTPQDVINIVTDHASEWIEHSENPDAFVSGILAKEIVKLMDRIEYLEKRLQHVSTR